MTDGTPRDAMSQGDRVIDALRVYSTDYAEMMAQFSKWLGVHQADAGAFSEIVYAEETGAPLTPAKLSKRIGLTSGATTSLVNRLEEAGLIVRSREHSDRRLVTLRATTDVGRTARAVFEPVGARIDATMGQYPPEFLRDAERLLDDLHTVFQDAARHLGELTVAPADRTRKPRPPR